MDERYEGKPLLRLVELYVLDAIGALTPEHDALLKAMSPQLCQTYEIPEGGDWRQAIVKALGIPDDSPEIIRETWEKAETMAAKDKVNLAAETFAVAFVDANFNNA